MALLRVACNCSQRSRMARTPRDRGSHAHGRLPLRQQGLGRSLSASRWYQRLTAGFAPGPRRGRRPQHQGLPSQSALATDPRLHPQSRSGPAAAATRRPRSPAPAGRLRASARAGRGSRPGGTAQRPGSPGQPRAGRRHLQRPVGRLERHLSVRMGFQPHRTRGRKSRAQGSRDQAAGPGLGRGLEPIEQIQLRQKCHQIHSSTPIASRKSLGGGDGHASDPFRHAEVRVAAHEPVAIRVQGGLQDGVILGIAA